MPSAVDLHQHLWPEPFVDRLRARARAPFLRGWTLHTDGEPPKRGSTILVNMGCTANSSAALRNIAAV